MKIDVLQPNDLQPLISEIKELKKMLQELKNSHTSEKTSSNLKGLLSITSAAKIAGLSPNTLRKAIDNGLITAAPLVPGGHPRISSAELDRFIREHGRARIKTAKVPRAFQSMFNLNNSAYERENSERNQEL
jgi:excisionase family DNA binding protein